MKYLRFAHSIHIKGDKLAPELPGYPVSAKQLLCEWECYQKTFSRYYRPFQ